MGFASPAEGISAHLSSMKPPEPGPSLGKWSMGQWEICAPPPTVLLWMGSQLALGTCLFTTPLLPSSAQPSPLHSCQDHESLLTCSASPHSCPGWEQVQLAVTLTQPFSLSLESHFIELLFIKPPC